MLLDTIEHFYNEVPQVVEDKSSEKTSRTKAKPKQKKVKHSEL